MKKKNIYLASYQKKWREGPGQLSIVDISTLKFNVTHFSDFRITPKRWFIRLPCTDCILIMSYITQNGKQMFLLNIHLLLCSEGSQVSGATPYGLETTLYSHWTPCLPALPPHSLPQGSHLPPSPIYLVISPQWFNWVNSLCLLIASVHGYSHFNYHQIIPTKYWNR